MSFLSVVPGKDTYFFDQEQAVAAGLAQRRAYAGADPFPPTVIDDFLPGPLIERFLADFPPLEMASVVPMYDSAFLKRGYRSEERRVGKECVREFVVMWWPYP